MSEVVEASIAKTAEHKRSSEVKAPQRHAGLEFRVPVKREVVLSAQQW